MIDSATDGIIEAEVELVKPEPIIFQPKIDILLFSRAVLGLKLYWWQMDILLAIQAQYMAAAAICNGGGKTSVVIAAAILWFLYCWPNGRAPVISGSWSQVTNQLWPALESHRGKNDTIDSWRWLDCRIETIEGGFAVGQSPDDAKKAEGYHRDRDMPVMYILDEAKALDDRIINGVHRCTFSHYAELSSTGPAQGKFYESFERLKSQRWTIRVKSYDCPHITEDKRQADMIEYGGEHSPVYRSKHLSEFDDEATASIVSRASVRRALETGPAPLFGARSAFCDFAAGGDENVLAIAEGNRAWIEKAWREVNTVQAVRQFIKLFEKLDLSPSQIWADNTGMGTPMCYELAEAGWHVNRVENGATAMKPESYANRGSEIWFEASYMIERNEVVIPDDPIFIEQAVSRRREYDQKGRLRAESKQDMQRRGLRSPDRADGIFGVLVCRRAIGVFTATGAEKAAEAYNPNDPRGIRGNPFGVPHIRF